MEVDVIPSWQLYVRKEVEVTLLAEPVELVRVDVNTLVETLPRVMSGRNKVPAVTYVWNEPLSQLKAEPWSFEEFVETKLSRWA